MLDAKIVGRVLQRIREGKGRSQELVSGFAGIGRTHLSAIERGERKPTFGVVSSLRVYFGRCSRKGLFHALMVKRRLEICLV